MAEVEVDKMLCFVSYKTAKVAANDAVPSRSLSFVKCALDVLSNVLLDGELGHGFLSNFDRFVLHVLSHVSRLDLGFELLPGNRSLCLLVRHFDEFAV